MTYIQMKTLSGGDVSLEESMVDEFAAGLRGGVLKQGAASYDESRVIWNVMIDRNPAAVVRPGEAADVATAIEFARERDLPLAVRGGAKATYLWTELNDSRWRIQLYRDGQFEMPV